MKKFLGGLLVEVTVSMSAAQPAGAASGAASGLVSGGHVVSHKDVDGDGRGDVGWLHKLSPLWCASG